MYEKKNTRTSHDRICLISSASSTRHDFTFGNETNLLAIHSFSRHASKANPSIAPLGPKLADSNHKEWDQASLRAGRNVINTFQYGRMDGSNQGKHGITFGGKKEIDRNYSGAPKYLDRAG